MSVPTEADFAIVRAKVGSGSTYDPICGIENVSINKTVNANDSYRRDCAKPGIPGARKNKVTGKSLTISASGGSNVDNIVQFESLLGIAHDYQVELRNQDGSDTGVLLGTYTGRFMMMSDNMATSSGGDSSGEITLNNEGPWTYADAA